MAFLQQSLGKNKIGTSGIWALVDAVSYNASVSLISYAKPLHHFAITMHTATPLKLRPAWRTTPQTPPPLLPCKISLNALSLNATLRFHFPNTATATPNPLPAHVFM